MTSSGWREALVDIDSTQSNHKALRFVLSPSPTPASSLYTAGRVGEEEGAWLEVCPQGLVHAQEIGDRVARSGGAALIADYGGTGDSKDTLRVSQGGSGGSPCMDDVCIIYTHPCRHSASISNVLC